MEQDNIDGIFNQLNNNNNGKEISNKNENKLSNIYLNKERSKLMEERAYYSNNPKYNLIISKTNNLFNNNNNILSQNLDNSKNFVTNQLNNLITNIENYKKEKDFNINKELSIINNFGIILKNMVTSQRCTWFDNLNLFKSNNSKIKIDLNDFNHLDDSDFIMILIKSNLFVPMNLKQIQIKNDFSNFLNKNIIFNYLEINYDNYKVIFSNNYNEIGLNDFISIKGDINYFDKENDKYTIESDIINPSYTFYEIIGKKKLKKISEETYNDLKNDNNKGIRLRKELNLDSFLKRPKQQKKINEKIIDIDNTKKLKEFDGLIYNKLTKKIKNNYFYLDKDFKLYLYNNNNFIELDFGKEIRNYFSSIN